MDLLLLWLRWLLFRPGMVFMDWLARTYPDIVIQYGFGFSDQSYLFWSAVVSSVFWAGVIFAVLCLVRLLRRVFQ